MISFEKRGNLVFENAPDKDIKDPPNVCCEFFLLKSVLFFL